MIWLLRNKSVVTKGIGLSEVAGPLHLQWHGQSTRDGTAPKGKIQCYMDTGVVRVMVCDSGASIRFGKNFRDMPIPLGI